MVLENLPQNIIVRGGGATGVEWASAYHRYGRKVTLVGNIVPQEVESATADVAGVRRGCIAAFGSVDAATGTERSYLI